MASVELLSDALGRLTALTRVVLTPGNHDSATRLGFGAGLFRDRLAVRSRVAGLGEPVVLPDADGDAGALVYALPYLDPDMSREELAETGEDGARVAPARSHEAVTAAALRRVHADLATRRAAGPRVPAVLLAHAFVTGGAPSESERDIRVGGVDAVPSGVFGPASALDYVALGHLHGPQRVGREGVDPVMRYAGSPLAFSFSEAAHHKSTALVDLGADGVRAVELVPTPVPRRLGDVTGTLAELLGQAFDDRTGDWVRVTVTDDVRPEQLWAAGRTALPARPGGPARPGPGARARGRRRHERAGPAGGRGPVPRRRRRASGPRRRARRAARGVRGRPGRREERLMRIHRLTLQAIGPYPGRHTIDFDTLSAGGLFLLEGPTGAGKSTIIDAVVFGLYGKVAGEHASDDRLHSDHAAPDVEPFVELVFSTGAGIYRVWRSPAFLRPKKRGGGFTQQNARAKLWRLAAVEDDAGEAVSAHVQEVGTELGRIVVLDRTQFTQTVVLPQGQFASFLRAKPEDRRAVLQDVFGTEVYERLQKQLAEMARTARADLERGSRQIQAAAATFLRAAGRRTRPTAGVAGTRRTAPTTRRRRRGGRRPTAAPSPRRPARRGGDPRCPQC